MNGNFTLENTSLTVELLHPHETQPVSCLESIPAALVLDGARIHGSVLICQADRKPPTLIEAFHLSDAFIEGSLTLSNVSVSAAKAGTAFDAERLRITGSLSFDSTSEQKAVMSGGIRLLGAHVGGQLLFRGIDIIPTNHAAAVVGDGVKVDGDIHFGGSVDLKHQSLICGQLRFPGATIGGEFAVIGITHQGGDETKFAFNLSYSSIRGGVFLHSTQGKVLTINGGLSLKGADIGTDVSIKGIQLRSRLDGVAVGGDGVTIRRDLIITRHPAGCSIGAAHNTKSDATIEGSLRLAGSEIKGMLRVTGASIAASQDDAAVLISGARIGGGIYFNSYGCEECGNRVSCVIDGALRMNHSEIGSKVSLEGVRLSCLASGPGVALYANGARLAGDLALQADAGGNRCIIKGELRLLGASIEGELSVVSAILEAASTGVALDCYNSSVNKGCRFVGLTRTKTGGRSAMLSIRGIVALAYADMGSLVIGSLEPWRDRTAGPGAIVEGHLRLSGAKVKDFTALQGVRFSAPLALSSDLCDLMTERLQQWGIYDKRLIVDCEGAQLGNFLGIDLDPLTSGTVNLCAARVNELRDRDARGWGTQPIGPGWSSSSQRPEWEGSDGVKLELDGFSYDRFGAELAFFPETHGFLNRLRCYVQVIQRWVLRRSQLRFMRLAWLDMQYPNRVRTGVTFNPRPYLQLAGVFRSHGHARDADFISLTRRRHHTLYSQMGMFDRVMQWAYGWMFGFGYHSSRALLAVLILLAINCATVLEGAYSGWLVGTAGKASSAAIAEGVPLSLGNYLIGALFQTFSVLHFPTTVQLFITANAPWYYRGEHFIILILDWIMIPAAILTLSGVLRENNK